MVPRRAGRLQMKYALPVMLGFVLLLALFYGQGSSQAYKELAEKDEELKNLYAVVEDLSNRLEKMTRAAQEQEEDSLMLREEKRRLQSQIATLLKQGAVAGQEGKWDAAEGSNSEVSEQEARNLGVEQPPVKQVREGHQGGDKQQEYDSIKQQDIEEQEEDNLVKQQGDEQQLKQEEVDIVQLKKEEDVKQGDQQQLEQGEDDIVQVKKEEDAIIKQQGDEQQLEQEEDATVKQQHSEQEDDTVIQQGDEQQLEQEKDATAKQQHSEQQADVQQEDDTVKQQESEELKEAEQEVKQQGGDTAPPPLEATSISQENDDRKRDALGEES